MRCLRALWLALLLLSAGTVQPAQPGGEPGDAQALQLSCPERVQRRTPFRCSVSVRVADGGDPRELQLAVQLHPPFLRVAETPGLAFDPSTRLFTWVDHGAGGVQRRFDIDVVAFNVPENALPAEISASLRDPAAQRQRTSTAALRIGSDHPHRTRIGSGWLPVSPAVLMLGVLAPQALLVVLVRRRQLRQGRHASAGVGAWIFGLLLADLCLGAGVLALDDLRAHTGFVPTRCEVLDHAAIGHQPAAALRYAVDGVPMVSAGFELDNRFYGQGDGERHRTLETGATLPCWYDPAEPRSVVLRRTPGAMPVIATLLLLVLLAWWRARRRRRGR